MPGPDPSNTPSTFSGTLTAGIQDISALLPLLGTEQCDKHVGSALDKGLLYSAVTPLSIFGSLGIVRASFNILLASVNIPHFEFLGAQALSNSGFSPSGTVACMIALDPQHPKRFLAETRLEEMLAEEQMDNVDDLVVSWSKSAVLWNLLLVVLTLVISSAGLLPYFSIIIESGDISSAHFFPVGFGFPFLRLFGSVACVIFAQFLIQIRLLIILKTRLIFIGIERWTQVKDEFNMNGAAQDLGDVGGLAHAINKTLKREAADDVWGSELAAERSIWTFRKWAATSPSDAESSDQFRHQLQALFTAYYDLHFSAQSAGTVPPWITILLCLGLAIGCISTVVGYIGCFFLIQHATSAKGTLLWLGLESLFSIIRIIVWAINPSWDDSEGISFSLRLSSDPPMITCNTPLMDTIRRRTDAPLTISSLFLAELRAYIGPLPPFEYQDVELYYMHVAVSFQERSLIRHSTPQCKTLLIVISTHKGQSNLMLSKDPENRGGDLALFKCTLRADPDAPVIHVTVGVQTRPEDHFLTQNSSFMAKLRAHYEMIDSQLRCSSSKWLSSRKAIF